MKVWKLDGLVLLSSRSVPTTHPTFVSFRQERADVGLIFTCSEIPKRANEIKLLRDVSTILVADKFGDIFRCSPSPLHLIHAVAHFSFGLYYPSTAPYDSAMLSTLLQNP